MKCDLFKQFLILCNEEILAVIFVVKIVTSMNSLCAEYFLKDELARECVRKFVEKILERPQGDGLT
jgi:hypothetical protein